MIRAVVLPDGKGGVIGGTMLGLGRAPGETIVHLWTAALVPCSGLVLVVGFTAWRGRDALPHANFFTQDMQASGPLDPLTRGGIGHAMPGTLVAVAHVQLPRDSRRVCAGTRQV